MSVEEAFAALQECIDLTGYPEGGFQVEMDAGQRALQELRELIVLYAATLVAVGEAQRHALHLIEENGFVFGSIGAEPGNWQHLAFTLYTQLCELESLARLALSPPD